MAALKQIPDHSASKLSRPILIGAATIAAVIAIGGATVAVTGVDAESATAGSQLAAGATESTATTSRSVQLFPMGTPPPVQDQPLAAAAVPADGGADNPRADSGQVSAVASTAVPSQTRILKLVKRSFPADEVGNAMAVAQCESGQGNLVGSTNTDGTTDFGVFQLNDGGTLQGSLGLINYRFGTKTEAQNAALREEVNVPAAAALWRARGGWGPWVCASKLQIVDSLYSNKRGPAYGAFTAVGNPLMTLAAAKPVDPPKKPTAKPPAPAQPTKPGKSPNKPKKPGKPKESTEAPTPSSPRPPSETPSAAPVTPNPETSPSPSP